MSDISPNRDQTELWNEGSGEAWVDMQVLLDRMLEPFGRLVVDAGYPGEGGHVLDIGCGLRRHDAGDGAPRRREAASCVGSTSRIR